MVFKSSIGVSFIIYQNDGVPLVLIGQKIKVIFASSEKPRDLCVHNAEKLFYVSLRHQKLEIILCSKELEKSSSMLKYNEN